MFADALTFDDVLLVPQYSEVLPAEAKVNSEIASGCPLSIPIVSAAMDTVTESPMAIAMARAGGLGIIHKNLSPEAQAKEVLRVKKSESGMIVDPITIAPDASLQEAIVLKEKYDISGIPVVKEGRLVGIVTNRDLRFAQDTTRKVQDIMTKEVVTAHEGIALDDAKALLQQHRIEKLPVVDEANRLRGLITIKDIEKSEQHPDATKDALGRLRVGAAVGVGPERDERAAALVKAGADMLAIDTAHGHSRAVLDGVKALRQAFPDVAIMAGNVATAEATKALMDVGANTVKVGIGPGSICTTRIVAGVGVPQLTAVLDCVKAAKGTDVRIVADGGIRSSGDVVKALAAGADSVMVGSLLAGTEEAPGEVVLYQGRSYKAYRGMGSLGAMGAGSADRYFQSNVREAIKFVPEGVEGMVPYRGSVQGTLYQLVGGLRSGMGYVGASDLSALKRNAKMVRITNAGSRESHVHDITVTKEPPNYRSTSP